MIALIRPSNYCVYTPANKNAVCVCVCVCVIACVCLKSFFTFIFLLLNEFTTSIVVQ